MSDSTNGFKVDTDDEYFERLVSRLASSPLKDAAKEAIDSPDSYGE